MESEGDEIKSKQASKRDGTLLKLRFVLNTFWAKITKKIVVTAVHGLAWPSLDKLGFYNIQRSSTHL